MLNLKRGEDVLKLVAGLLTVLAILFLVAIELTFGSLQ